MDINYNIAPTLNVAATYLDTLDFNPIFFGINTPSSLILTDLVTTFHLHFLKLRKVSSFTVFSEAGSPTHTVSLHLVPQRSQPELRTRL